MYRDPRRIIFAILVPVIAIILICTDKVETMNCNEYSCTIYTRNRFFSNKETAVLTINESDITNYDAGYYHHSKHRGYYAPVLTLKNGKKVRLKSMEARNKADAEIYSFDDLRNKNFGNNR